MRNADAEQRWPGILVACLLSGVSLGAATGLEWQAQPGCRSAVVTPGPTGQAGFTMLPAKITGIQFTNVCPPSRHLTNQIYLNGSGVAAGDIDGDGWCDVFFCGLEGRSVLYRNLGGFRFEDITRSSGLALAKLDAAGAVLVDINGDRHLDLIVNSYGQGTLVYTNRGSGQFAPLAHTPVLNPHRGGTSLALADIDGDGDLDLYLANYRTSTIRDQPNLRLNIKTVDGKPQVVAINGRPLTHPDLTNRFNFRYKMLSGGGASVLHDERGEPDALYRNDGPDGFVPVPFSRGFRDESGQPLDKPPFDWGLSVMLRDLNGDHAPDIYVCNDFSTPDRLWINDGHGGFRALPVEAIRHTSLSTMSLDIADVNRDGFDDIFTADMLSPEHWRRVVQKNEPNPNMPLFVDVSRQPQYPRNMLQINRGDGTYAELAQLAGLEASEWTWTPAFLDVDLDGFEDLLVVNGFERDYMNMDANREIGETRMRRGRRLSVRQRLELNRLYPRLPTPNLAFRNLGHLRFTDQSQAWGFDVPAVSQGMCLADLDNDGDQDLVINNLNTAATVLRNNSARPRVAVRLRGRPPNTRGIGAVIRLQGGPVPEQSQQIICGGRYLSCDDAMRVFAAGPDRQSLTLAVTWRNGTQTVLTNVRANRIYEVEEGSAQPAAPPTPLGPPAPPLFVEVSRLLGHSNTIQSLDDLQRQPLLPNRLNRLGPGVAWFDLDGDHWDDLILGGSRGGTLAVYHNNRHGGFARVNAGAFAAALTNSQSAVLGWRNADGSSELLVGSSNYDQEPTGESQVLRYDAARHAPLPPLPAGRASLGPLALADLDGDGSLDLFVGGRCLPGHWPQPVSSRIFRRADGQWTLDTTNTSQLADVGLVSGAGFTDLDADGDPDLVLACEWGPVRVFRNDRGQLQDATAAWGLDRYVGWWAGIAAGDFDGDGRMDLAVANRGRNTKYERFRAQPLRLYYGDLNGDGATAIVESCYDRTLKRYVPFLSLWALAPTLPWLRAHFDSFEAFGRSSIEQALGERFNRARLLTANWLESTVFLNRGGRFEARPLPVEAQVSPAFAVCVSDFDGDGREDLFLSQNFFGTRPDTSRYDAGRGLLLRGRGNGSFNPVPGQQSGLMIYGEQRGAAVADYDQDGRPDLVVTQAGDRTRLFHNRGGRPGLRVRLAGPPGNPAGIGAVLRVKSGTYSGPAREVHAGSGYWSQNSAVQVIAVPRPKSGIEVRWPGGKTSSKIIPTGASEVVVDVSGAIQAVR